MLRTEPACGRPAWPRTRILEEIEVAHRMGIEVFVTDTGWYEKTNEHPHDMMTRDGKPHGPAPVWETGDSCSFQLVEAMARVADRITVARSGRSS